MKVKLGVKNCLYPMPTTIVGALVHGKPNYVTIAHVGIMELNSISLGMNKSHYTNHGIKQNKTFSVNIPSAKIVKETDHCGLVSGKNDDKTAIFTTFYGSLQTAPMIEQCCINMECELVRTIDFPNHDVFIGRIMETYCDESVLTGKSRRFWQGATHPIRDERPKLLENWRQTRKSMGSWKRIGEMSLMSRLVL